MCDVPQFHISVLLRSTFVPRDRDNCVCAVMCSSGIWRSSYQVLLYAAWAGGGILQPQHGPYHASAVSYPEGGGRRRGARSNTFTWSELLLYYKTEFVFHRFLLKNPKRCVCICPAESNNLPPQLPPRNFPANDFKDSDPKSPEQSCKSLSDTYLMRLQHMDMST